jgi:hypothetical protein
MTAVSSVISFMTRVLTWNKMTPRAHKSNKLTRPPICFCRGWLWTSFPGTSADSPPCDLSYTVLFNNGSTVSIPLQDMASLIPPPSVSPSSVGNSLSSQDSLLLPFLCINSKITYKHEGQYHKGYLLKHNSSYWFSFKSHVNKKKEDWGIDLPNLVMNWVNLCIKGILIPGHVSHTFLHSPSLFPPMTFDPVASFVSAINLHLECPPFLLKALADSHPDCEVWLRSFFKEKQGIQSMNTYRKITLGKYCDLCEKGAPKAIPTMCVLTVKRDENLNPLWAKSWMVVLGNHKDCVWSKCNHFASVLCSNSLWFLVSMAVEKRCPLRQGDCKNAFSKAFCPQKRLRLFDPPQVIPRLSQMNIGFFSGLFTAFAAALDIGTKKSTKFSFPLVLPLLSRIHASSPVLFKIPTIPAVMFPITPSLLVSMLTTSFSSWRIPRLRTYSATFSASVAK